MPAVSISYLVSEISVPTEGMGSHYWGADHGENRLNGVLETNPYAHKSSCVFTDGPDV